MGYDAIEVRGVPRGRDVSPQQAERVLNNVLGSGGNFIDTSTDYGTSEEFILRFTFTHLDLDTNIVGTINLEHVHQSVEAFQKGPLPPDVYAGAKRRLVEAGTAPARA